MIKKFFLKRFKSYFFIMFLPMAIIFLATGYFIVSSQLKDIEHKSNNTLNSFDENIESSLYNIGYQLDMMMSNTSFSLSLKSILSNNEMEQKDQSFYRVLKNFLNTYELSFKYINSIYLYIDGKDKFITSSHGQIVDKNSNYFYDLDWLDEYEHMDSEKEIFTSRRWIQKNSYDEPTEVISVYYANTYLDGAVLINIDKSQYGRLLRTILISDRQKIFLVNDKGDVICTTDQSFETMDSKNQLEKIVSSYVKEKNIFEFNNNWVKIGAEYYYMNYKYSEYMNIYLISAIPINHLFEELRFYFVLIILVIIANLIIITSLAYLYTKRSFSYIEECINVFSDAEQGKVVKRKVDKIDDEYGLLLNNIIYLHLKSNQVQLKLMEKHHLYEMTQMMALQLQINPHFIFNTLQIMDIEVIQNLGEKSTLHKITQQLSMVIKYALTTPTDEVTLSEELTYLRAYLEIQNIRFNNNNITYFDIDESLYDIKVFKLLLQPVLENSFAHGRRSDGMKMVIKIKIYDKKDYITFSIIDNGLGMDKKRTEEVLKMINDSNSKSIGLTNLNRRLCLRYGQASELKIRSKKEVGTIVKFSIPKLNNETF